jgi:hypothetical protein
MLILVTLAVSTMLLDIQRRLMAGGVFTSYFGWFSWGFATFPLLLAALFFVAGVLQSWLMRTNNAALWAFALGACYTFLRLFFVRSWFARGHQPVEILWAVIEMLVPPLAAWGGALLVARSWHHVDR